jgi:hypothetical protein
MRLSIFDFAGRTIFAQGLLPLLDFLAIFISSAAASYDVGSGGFHPAYYALLPRE